MGDIIQSFYILNVFGKKIQLDNCISLIDDRNLYIDCKPLQTRVWYTELWATRGEDIIWNFFLLNHSFFSFFDWRSLLYQPFILDDVAIKYFYGIKSWRLSATTVEMNLHSSVWNLFTITREYFYNELEKISKFWYLSRFISTIFISIFMIN